MTLMILEGNCNGEAYEFWGWMTTRHPEIEVEFVENTSGAGGGLFDDDGNEIDNPYWDEYCND